MVCVSVLSGCGFATSTATVIERAQRNFNAHHYRAAAVDLQNVVAKRPEDASLRLELAQALLHVGRYAEADAAFRRAGQLGVSRAQVLPGLAETLLEEGQAQQVLDELAKPSSPTPPVSDAVLLSLRGRALLALGKLDDAQASLTPAVAANPQDTRAHVALAELLQRRGNTSGAKSELDRTIAAAPTDFSAHLALGIWNLEENHNREAHDELTRALGIAVEGIRAGSEPPFDEARALTGLADADLQAGDVKSAEQRLERLRKVSPKARATSLLQARIDLRQNHLDEARTDLQELLTRDPDDETAMVLLATADAAGGHLEQADMYLTSILAKTPMDLAARRLLAKVELAEHRPDAALRTATDPNTALDSDLLALASRASAESGNTGAAMSYLERSEKAAPENDARALQLASAYLTHNRAADAVKLLQGLQVSDTLALRREALLLTALSRNGPATDVQSEARRFATAHAQDEASLLVAAQAFLSTHDPDDARNLINQAAQLSPKSPRPWIALGLLEGSLGHRDPARTALQHALQLDPRNVTALVLQARILLQSGDAAGAAVPLSQARTLAPDNPTVLLLSGALALSQRDGHDAADIFRKLTSRYPKSAVLQADLSRALALAGKLAEARSASAEAMKLSPNYWPAIYLDASLSLAARDFDRAAQGLSQLRTLKAPAPVVQTLQGDLAIAQGKLAEALNDYGDAARAAPSAVLAEKMTRVRFQLHQADPAAPMKDWLERYPHDARTRLVLAQFLQGSGDPDGAGKAYEAVLADVPNDLVALNNLAWLRLSAGKIPAGLALAQRAYAIAPSQSAVADTYGWALVQSGKAGDAIAILRSAHAAAPRDPEIHLHFATALLKTGDRTAARSELQQIIEGEPQAPQTKQARSMLAGLGITATNPSP